MSKYTAQKIRLRAEVGARPLTEEPWPPVPPLGLPNEYGRLVGSQTVSVSKCK